MQSKPINAHGAIATILNTPVHHLLPSGKAGARFAQSEETMTRNVTMKIHPITDIFLVVGAAAIGGPLLAFCIVPIYSIIKLILQKLKENNMLSFLSKVDNSNKV